VDFAVWRGPFEDYVHNYGAFAPSGLISVLRNAESGAVRPPVRHCRCEEEAVVAHSKLKRLDEVLVLFYVATVGISKQQVHHRGSSGSAK
jgi:hypothetical protein